MSQADILAQMGKLQNEKVSTPVGTFKIKEQAVTNMVSAYTEDAIGLWAEVETTIQQCTIDATGFPIFLIWDCSVGPDPEAWHTIYIYRDTTLIYERDTFLVDSEIIGSSIVDTPDAGTYTYYLNFKDLDTDGGASRRSMMLLEVKR